jgi:hypothetical protein
LFSLKHEFPQAYHKLLHPEGGNLQTTNFEITYSHFPFVLRSKELNIDETKVYLKPQSGQSITLPNNYKIDANKIVNWDDNEDIDHGTRISTTKKDRIKGGTVTVNGSPIKSWSIGAGVNDLKKDELDDILILIKYKIT